jgi:hypothetical protein
MYLAKARARVNVVQGFIYSIRSKAIDLEYYLQMTSCSTVGIQSFDWVIMARVKDDGSQGPEKCRLSMGRMYLEPYGVLICNVAWTSIAFPHVHLRYSMHKAFLQVRAYGILHNVCRSSHLSGRRNRCIVCSKYVLAPSRVSYWSLRRIPLITTVLLGDSGASYFSIAHQSLHGDFCAFTVQSELRSKMHSRNNAKNLGACRNPTPRILLPCRLHMTPRFAQL